MSDRAELHRRLRLRLLQAAKQADQDQVKAKRYEGQLQAKGRARGLRLAVRLLDRLA